MVKKRFDALHGVARTAVGGTVFVLVAILSGCGGDRQAGESTATSTEPAATSTGSGAGRDEPEPSEKAAAGAGRDEPEPLEPAAAGAGRDEPEPLEPAAAGVVIDIRIVAGEVSPAGKQVEATVGEPIELRVDSDVIEELHLHTTPDQTFDVEATAGQVFTLTIDRPGQVELEVEGAGVLVAQLVVRP